MPRSTQIRDGQIFLYGHVRRGPEQRVLKQPPYHAAPLMLRHKGNVQIVKVKRAFIDIKAARNRVEKGGFSRTVGADNGRKITVRQGERELLQCELLVDRTLVKGLF